MACKCKCLCVYVSICTGRDVDLCICVLYVFVLISIRVYACMYVCLTYAHMCNLNITGVPYQHNIPVKGTPFGNQSIMKNVLNFYLVLRLHWCASNRNPNKQWLNK